MTRLSCRRALLHGALAAIAVFPLSAQLPQTEYRQRREAIAAAMPGDGVILALGAPEPSENYLSFHQAPRFNWLTGFDEADAGLLIVRRGTDRRSILFVQPKDPAAEVWTGNRFGTESAARITGMETREFSALQPTLDSLLASGLALSFVPATNEGGELAPWDDAFMRALRTARPDVRPRNLAQAVDERRGRKTAEEMELIRKAVAITVEAHREAMRAIEPDMNEFEVEALVEYTFRRNGAQGPSFASIIGSGPNSTTLHYNRDDRFMRAGEVVVMDIGASYRGYAADVTRTVPVSGTFSAEQRAIYQIVRDAQAAAERNAKPGAEARVMSDSASAVLDAGVARLGLTEGRGATYDCAQQDGQWRQCPQLSLYYMHGLGHGIGLDVHDPEQFYFTGRIAAGSAFTIEPGIYVRANLLEILPDTPRNRSMIARIRPAVQRYANVGVRIEDDYIVTATGAEWISRAPREIAEIEALMRERWAGPGPRRVEFIRWYEGR